MNRTPPWSVKGVGDDARDIARKAAQAEGLTLGAWIDRAIRKSTGLVVNSAESKAGTTTGTTEFRETLIDQGKFLEVDNSTTLADETPPNESARDSIETTSVTCSRSLR